MSELINEFQCQMNEIEIIFALDKIKELVEETKGATDYKKRLALLSQIVDKTSELKSEIRKQDPQYYWEMVDLNNRLIRLAEEREEQRRRFNDVAGN